MAHSQVCTCCFLNRISILRNSSDRPSGKPSDAEKTALSDRLFEQSTKGFFDIASNPPEKSICDMNVPERLVEKKVVKSSDTFVVIGAAGESRTKTKNSVYSSAGSELARKISLVLEKQKQFLQSLSVSMTDDGSIELGDNEPRESESAVDVRPVRRGPMKDRVAFYSSGDQIGSIAKAKCARKPKKPIFMNGKHEGSEGGEFLSLNDADVKLLFFPENGIKGSCSSEENGTGSCSGSSAYLTAANSRSEDLGRAMFASADLVCRTDSQEVFKID